MSLTISSELLALTNCDGLARLRKIQSGSHRDGETRLDTTTLSESDLADLKRVFEEGDNSRSAKAVDAILKARRGEADTVVPNFAAFEEILRIYLSSGAIEGWVFKLEDDGKMHPYLVTSIATHTSRQQEEPRVDLKLVGYTAQSTTSENVMAAQTKVVSFTAGMAARRRVSSILQAVGIYKETDALHEEYRASLERYRKIVAPQFAEQFRVTGNVHQTGYSWHSKDSDKELVRRKVVHDLSEKDYRAFNPLAEAGYGGAKQDAKPKEGRVPEHLLVRVFDLGSHESYWVHSDYMEPYVYDKTLGDKLILPESHRDLLSVLTTNLEDFTEDFIEGKRAGNVILCKGRPGVGKTLTAEIYAELIERPLYSIHSGTLGTSANEIERALKLVYARAKRWNCVLLLDEADVFVAQRGGDVNKNAIVAEFLRTMEYFDGLMFMTTNRPDDIDDAIISRCIAVIEYTAPSTDLARRSWMAIEGQFGVKLDDSLREDLLKMFPEIVQRDIKMLLKLVLKMKKGGKGELDLDSFRRAAMFRAIKIKDLGA